jgi:hypothetical protein
MLLWIAEEHGEWISNYVAYESSNWFVAYWLRDNGYIELSGQSEEINAILTDKGEQYIAQNNRPQSALTLTSMSSMKTGEGVIFIHDGKKMNKVILDHKTGKRLRDAMLLCYPLEPAELVDMINERTASWAK